MTEANVYAPPTTDIRQQGNSEGHDPALKSMSTKDLKKLFNHSHTIRALIFLWCLGLTLLTLFIPFMLFDSSKGSNNTDGSLMLLVLVPLFFLQVGAVYGCWNRLPWGRTVGIIICVLSLPSVPIGTAIGILGIIAFAKAKRLFGPDRLTHTQLKAEVAYRKAHNIR
jgi:hypothetical protein